MDFLKGVAGKVVTGLVALAVAATAISWWQMDDSTRATLLRGTGRILGWLAIVMVIPFVSFSLIGRIARMDSNAAGGTLVLAISAVEAILLAWLFDWSIRGAGPWVFFVAATLIAGAALGS